MQPIRRCLYVALLTVSLSSAFADPAHLSREAVQAEVNGLKNENVAWRKIDWKTCLLDGLKASREQNKPIILWIFIDRPIDDERC